MNRFQRTAFGLAALIVAPNLAFAQPVIQTGTVAGPGGGFLQLAPTTQFNQQCNGGAGGIVGQVGPVAPYLSTVCGPPAGVPSSLPLPANAAQETGGNLAAINAKLPASLGAKTGANSLSVVSASDGFAVNQAAPAQTLLTSASVSGSIQTITAGGPYQFNVSGTFGGASLAFVQVVGGVTTTLATYTAAPGYSPVFIVPQGATIQATITGGSGTSLSASMAYSPMAATFYDQAGLGFLFSNPQVIQGATPNNNAPLGTLYPLTDGCRADNGTELNYTAGAQANMSCDTRGHNGVVLHGNNSTIAVGVGTDTGTIATGNSGLDVRSRTYGFNGTSWDRWAFDINNSSSGTAPGEVETFPSTLAAAGIGPVAEGSAASSIVLSANPANLYWLQVDSSAVAGYVMVLDATSWPADGAVTPKFCQSIAANTGATWSFNPPLRMATGAVAGYSTTGCFSKTASTPLFISGQVK